MTIEGVKHDNGKAPMSLIAYDVIEKVAHVLGFGAKKYAPNNWKKGMKMSRVMDATFRHLTAWNEGEDIDPESGLNHIDHALCELMFLRWYIIHRPDLDDRYKETLLLTNEVKEDLEW